MPIDFPSSANTGDIYTEGVYSYEYTGVKWKPVKRTDYTVEASDIEVANNELVIDFDSDGVQTITLSDNANVVFSNPPGYGEYKKLLSDLTTANADITLAWPSDLEWENGETPALPDLSENMQIEIEARTDYRGTNYVARLVGRNF